MRLKKCSLKMKLDLSKFPWDIQMYILSLVDSLDIRMHFRIYRKVQIPQEINYLSRKLVNSFIDYKDVHHFEWNRPCKVKNGIKKHDKIIVYVKNNNRKIFINIYRSTSDPKANQHFLPFDKSFAWEVRRIE